MSEKSSSSGILLKAGLIGAGSWLLSLIWSRAVVAPMMEGATLYDMGPPVIATAVSFLPAVVVFLWGLIRMKAHLLLSVPVFVLLMVSFVPVQDSFHKKPAGGRKAREAVLTERAEKINAKPIPEFPALPDMYFRYDGTSQAKPGDRNARAIMAGRLSALMAVTSLDEKKRPEGRFIQLRTAKVFLPKAIEDCTSTDEWGSGESYFNNLIFEPGLPFCVTSTKIHPPTFEPPATGITMTGAPDKTGSYIFRYLRRVEGGNRRQLAKLNRGIKAPHLEYEVVQSYRLTRLREVYKRANLGGLSPDLQLYSDFPDTGVVWTAIEPPYPQDSIVPEDVIRFSLMKPSQLERLGQPVLSYREQAMAMLGDSDLPALRRHFLEVFSVLDGLNERSETPLRGARSRMATIATAMCLAGECDPRFEAAMIDQNNWFNQDSILAYLNTLPEEERSELRSRILADWDLSRTEDDDRGEPYWVGSLREDAEETRQIR